MLSTLLYKMIIFVLFNSVGQLRPQKSTVTWAARLLSFTNYCSRAEPNRTATFSKNK